MYAHLLGYIAFAGVVTIGLGLASAYLIIDTMVKRFVTKADYLRVPVEK